MAEKPALPPSLRARALQWLAQREHSRQELGERLRYWVRAQTRVRQSVRPAAEISAFDEASPGVDWPRDSCGPHEARTAAPEAFASAEEHVEPLLDALQTEGLLSDARFVESRVHVRAARFGQRRIQQELRQHGVEMPPSVAETLRSTEFQRACDIWSRRFGGPPASLAEQARRARFLAGRGFSGQTIREVIQWAVQGRADTEEPGPID